MESSHLRRRDHVFFLEELLHRAAQDFVFGRRSFVVLGDRRVRAIVVISDPARIVTQHGNLAQAFDLTATEARVLALLCAGKPTRSIAARLSIAPSTTRLHIEHLLKKSGCHRQSDLVRCALTGSAAWLLRPNGAGVSQGSEIKLGRQPGH